MVVYVVQLNNCHAHTPKCTKDVLSTEHFFFPIRNIKPKPIPEFSYPTNFKRKHITYTFNTQEEYFCCFYTWVNFIQQAHLVYNVLVSNIFNVSICKKTWHNLIYSNIEFSSVKSTSFLMYFDR